MSSFPAHSKTLICGDYNARTNICPDYLDDFPYGSYGDLPVISPVDNKRSTLLLGMFESGKLKRFSKDEARINRYGVQLIEFCKAPGLLVVNGRIGRGKGIGDFTRDDTTGRNIDDYMICNPELFSIIDNLTIEPRVPESDHRGLSLKLTCNSIRNSRTAPNWTLHKRFIWSNDDLHYMNVVIKDDHSQYHRQVFLDVLVDLSDTNEVAGLLACIYHKRLNVSVEFRNLPVELNLTVHRGLIRNVKRNGLQPYKLYIALNATQIEKCIW